MDLTPGDTWCVVDKKWLDAFLHYATGMDGRIPREPGNLDNRALVRLPSQNIDIGSRTDDDEFAEALHKFKKRELVMRRGLVEGRDFALISEGQEKLLRAWYHASPRIARRAVHARSGLIVELFPLQLWAQLGDRQQTRRPVIASRTLPVEKLWELACKEVGADDGHEARVIAPGEEMTGGVVLDRTESRSLEEMDVDDGSVITFGEARERRTGVSESAGSAARIAGPASLPCPPPVSATGMDIIESMDDDNRRVAEVQQGVITRGNGLCGLANMGNTCFMNSSLQCLSNSELLTRYFLSGEWLRDLNTDNALGYSGSLAQEYAKLLGEIWSKNEALYPRSFKSMIARYAPQFTGYSQHDSQELLAFLLDGLHEDTNKIRKKPPTETPTGNGSDDVEIAALSWERYKMRNDSVVLDLFSGQYRSELVCPDCHNVSVTFDPFNNITVQLPQANRVNLTVTFHALDPLTPPAKVDLSFPRTDTVSRVKEELAKRFSCEAASIAIAEIFYSEFRTFHDGADKLWEYGRLQLDGDVHAYELDTALPSRFNDGPSRFRSSYSSSSYGSGSYGYGGAGQPVRGPEDGVSKNSICLKVMVRKAEKRSSYYRDPSYECAETPFVISLPTNTTDMYRTLRLRLCCKMARLLKEPWRSKFGRMLEEEGGFAQASCNQREEQDTPMSDSDGDAAAFGELLEGAFVVKKLSFPRQQGTELGTYPDMGLEDREMISVDWTQSGVDKVLDPEADDQAQQIGEAQSGSGATTVQQCLKLFTTPEVLSEQDTWFCGRCKSHVRATKTMGLWRLPKLLVLHLKRFSDEGWSREKVDTLVRFPVEGLDMSPYVQGPQEGGTMYDLYAVSNHFGGAGFGHYTAFCKSPADHKWYNFDDSSVRPCSDESVVSPAAYVLFYQQRGAAPPESLQHVVASHRPIRSS